MASIQEITLEDWNALVTIANKVDVGDFLNTAYVFRGQEDADWALKSSLHRAASNDGRIGLPAAEQLLRIEKGLTEKFRGVAPNHLPPATLSATNSIVDWWPLMRHFGVPTRILDWTASFYVAAYFAAAKAPDKDGAIYLVHAHTLSEAMRHSYGAEAEMPTSASEADKKFQRPDAPPVVFIFGRKTAMLDRMISQQGVFMASQNAEADIEEILASEIPKVANPASETLRKFRIRAAHKPMIMRRLRSMNVTASSLFPGLDGIGRQLDELVRNPW